MYILSVNLSVNYTKYISKYIYIALSIILVQNVQEIIYLELYSIFFKSHINKSHKNFYFSVVIEYYYTL